MNHSHRCHFFITIALKFKQRSRIGQELPGLFESRFKQILYLRGPSSRCLESFDGFLQSLQLVSLADLDRAAGILDKGRMFAALLERHLAQSHTELRTLGIDNEDGHATALFRTPRIAALLHSTPRLDMWHIFRGLGAL